MIKVGLNIGNSKISCAVSEIEKNKNIKLLSFQSFQTNIIKKNIITNFEELSNDIKSLIYLHSFQLAYYESNYHQERNN